MREQIHSKPRLENILYLVKRLASQNQPGLIISGLTIHHYSPIHSLATLKAASAV